MLSGAPRMRFGTWRPNRCEDRGSRAAEINDHFGPAAAGVGGRTRPHGAFRRGWCFRGCISEGVCFGAPSAPHGAFWEGGFATLTAKSGQHDLGGPRPVFGFGSCGGGAATNKQTRAARRGGSAGRRVGGSADRVSPCPRIDLGPRCQNASWGPLGPSPWKSKLVNSIWGGR